MTKSKTKYSSSINLPSIDLATNKTLQEKDFQANKKFVINFLKKHAGLTLKEVNQIFAYMQNKEWNDSDTTKFCKINFPGKRGVEYIEKLEPVMNDLNASYKKQLKHALLGA